MARNPQTLLRDYHAARWDEEMIMDLGEPGERGVKVPVAESEITRRVGDASSLVPTQLLRRTPPALPEVSQPRVNKHYTRLSQETMGSNVGNDIGQGTCTMKYNPVSQLHVATRHPGMTELHPLQDESTLQGILEMYYKLQEMLKETSGMDAVSLQSCGGGQAIYANASVVRAYHESRGDRQRDEVITTLLSHPANAAAPATAGYKVVTLMPTESGIPDMDALKAALSERTAAVFITNPEDTGVFNGDIDKLVQAAHDVGALCVYDMANANGLLGITRAREAGFDLCHYNAHKTFSTPHGSMGPALGAQCVTKELEPFLPKPIVCFDGERYSLNYDCPHSIGKIRSFIGNASLVCMAYTWIMNHGADGLREVAEVSVINNNYLYEKLKDIPGLTVYFAEGRRRLEQIRYSWDPLFAETGVGSDHIRARMVDYGVQSFFASHHVGRHEEEPLADQIVSEAMTPEPCESFSKDDIDEYAAVMAQISKEAYETPELVKTAPHNSSIHNVPIPFMEDIVTQAGTWRLYKKAKNLD
jgi:glycine dehydrogenase subunit 2